MPRETTSLYVPPRGRVAVAEEREQREAGDADVVLRIARAVARPWGRSCRMHEAVAVPRAVLGLVLLQPLEPVLERLLGAVPPPAQLRSPPKRPPNLPPAPPPMPITSLRPASKGESARKSGSPSALVQLCVSVSLWSATSRVLEHGLLVGSSYLDLLGLLLRRSTNSSTGAGCRVACRVFAFSPPNWSQGMAARMK